jgi:ubiquinone/menaquinone biosynthesis C-methylase UbiE
MKVLDIGCAKGFLVKDLMIACPGLEVYGLDISEYALLNAEPEVIGRLHLGSAVSLPFPDSSFDLVISINTLHNLERGKILTAISEIERVKKNNSYVVVDSYRNSLEKEIFQQWVLTAKFHDYPQGWIELFKEAGYTGDYHWTIIEQTGENE